MYQGKAQPSASSSTCQFQYVALLVLSETPFHTICAVTTSMSENNFPI